MSTFYGGTFLPPTYKINYVIIQESYVNMKDNSVYMHDNYVYMKITNLQREPDCYMGKIIYLRSYLTSKLQDET